MPSAFVERLLEANEPVWYRWDRDIPALLTELLTVAHREFETPPADKLLRRIERGRRCRLFWLLDRLLLDSQGEVFRPFPYDNLALFAWGRRLPPESRHLLIEEARNHKWRDAYMQAWCASCPDDQLISLFNWQEAWRSAPGVAHREVYPEEEFYSRFTDRAIRYRYLCEHLAKACAQFRNGDDKERTLARPIIHRVLGMAIKNAAATSPCPNECEPESGEEFSAWLHRTLETPPFAAIVEAAAELLRWWCDRVFATSRDYHARRVWVYSHGADDWQKLHEQAYSESEPFLFNHLADITPPEQLELWGRLIEYEGEDRGQMRAFCRWLPAEYTYLLQSHFTHPDGAWAAGEVAGARSLL